jgi:hypothetical protein
MRRLAIAVAVLVVAPAGAVAKELTKVEVCDRSACASVPPDPQYTFGGNYTVPAPPPGPTYRLRFTIDPEGTYVEHYRDGLLRHADGTWTELPTPLAEDVERAASNVHRPPPPARSTAESGGGGEAVLIAALAVAAAAAAAAAALVVRRRGTRPGRAV